MFEDLDDFKITDVRDKVKQDVPIVEKPGNWDTKTTGGMSEHLPLGNEVAAVQLIVGRQGEGPQRTAETCSDECDPLDDSQSIQDWPTYGRQP
nr:hypothetical protein CFP56_53384 [Quercus suber]